MKLVAAVISVFSLSIVGCSEISSDSTSSSWSMGHVTTGGGEGFKIIKSWGGSAGSVLSIEYHGIYSQCGIVDGDKNLEVWVSLNGKAGLYKMAHCNQYYKETDTGGSTVFFAALSISRGDGRYDVKQDVTDGSLFLSAFAEDGSPRRWDIQLAVKNQHGQWDSRYGQNYQFSL